MSADNRTEVLPETLTLALQQQLGERFSTARAIREHHGKDESSYPHALPDAVVFPHSTEEVVAVVNLCRSHGVPMIA